MKTRKKGKPVRPAATAVETSEQPVLHTVRTCAVTRLEYTRERLLRFTVDPMGRIMEDLTGRLPGRGVYVHPERAHLLALLKRPAPLARIASTPLQPLVAEELLERLERGLLRRLQDALGLAVRAGAARYGVDELTELYLAGTPPSLILLAKDTALNTRRKLGWIVAKNQGATIMEVLDREQLGAACGHKPVAVLVLTLAGIAKRIENDVYRWSVFQGSAAQPTNLYGDVS